MLTITTIFTIGKDSQWKSFHCQLCHFRHSAESEDLQLTNSGNDTVIYNGIPDWVNEEEVFEDNKAIWWSPDGSKLVYGVFNDTLVDIVNLPRYGNYLNEGNNKQGYPFLQYFMLDQFRYPKAGTTNPTVTLWYADVGPPGSPMTKQRYRESCQPMCPLQDRRTR